MTSRESAQLVAATLICFVIAAPTLHAQSKTKAPQTQAAEQRGTERSPFIVQVNPAPKPAAEIEADKKEKDSKSQSDWWLVLLTGVLALVGFLQLCVFGWQGIQLRNTVRASENEFIATHRPRVRVKHVWLTSDIWAGNPIVVNVTYVNNGTANAVFGETGVKFVVVRRDRQIPFDPRIRSIGFNPVNREIPSGRNWELHGLTDGTVLTSEQNTDIQQSKARLFCIGYVSYLDAAGRMRITGFCRVLRFPPSALAHTGNTRFRKFPDPDYEYED